MPPGEDLARPSDPDISGAARDYTEAVGVLETLLKAGAIEDTDVETLETARKELSQLRQ